jgi:hypothetical protein
METKQKIENEIKELEAAFKQKLICTNDYCTMLHTLLKKLKNF